MAHGWLVQYSYTGRINLYLNARSQQPNSEGVQFSVAHGSLVQHSYTGRINLYLALLGAVPAGEHETEKIRYPTFDDTQTGERTLKLSETDYVYIYSQVPPHWFVYKVNSYAVGLAVL